MITIRETKEIVRKNNGHVMVSAITAPSRLACYKNGSFVGYLSITDGNKIDKNKLNEMFAIGT